MKYHPVIKSVAKASKLCCHSVINDRKKEPTAWRQVAMYVMRDSGMSYAEIAAVVKKDISTIQITCAKLSKLLKQDWFTNMLNKIDFVASEIREEQDRKMAVDRICAGIPMRVYMNAFGMPDD